MVIDKYQVLFRITDDPLIVEIEYLGHVYQDKLVNPIPPTPEILDFFNTEWLSALEISGKTDILEQLGSPARTPVKMKKVSKKVLANSENRDEKPAVPVFGQINPLPKKRVKKK